MDDKNSKQKASAARMAASRARERAGRMLVPVELDQMAIDLLVGRGHLDETKRNDKQAVAAAVAILMRRIAIEDMVSKAVQSEIATIRLGVGR